MKRTYNAIRWPLGCLLIGLILLDSCKKNDSDPNAPTPTTSFCKSVEVKTTVNDLDFAFTFDDQLRIVRITSTDNGQAETNTYTYDSNGKLKDPTGDISPVYGTNGQLQQVILDGALFTFNSTGQLTNAVLTGDDGGNTAFTYTYDNNGDPVTIAGKVTDADGHTGTDNFTLDYLPDKLNGIPGSQQGEFVFLSTLTDFVPLTSKHLLNKWSRVLSIAGKTIPFTQQYTYTYDAQGRLTQLVHTGNPKNFYNFTYAQCQ